jgi:predicted Zn-dependent protease
MKAASTTTLSPSSTSTRSSLSGEQTVIALLNAGNPAAAEGHVRAMLARNPHDAFAHALLAHCRLDQEDKKGALICAREAAAINPDDWFVRRALLQMLMANDKVKEAEPIARDLAADDPDDSNVLFSLAAARLRKHDYRAAADLVDRAEAAAMGSTQSLLSIARIRVEQWRYAEAEALARQILQLDATRAEVFSILAECALAQGRAEESYDLALEALRLDPNDKAIYRLLTRARARRSSWLTPFLPGIDWLVDMDRRGLVLLALCMAPLLVIALVAGARDVALIQAGRAPVLVLTLAALGLLGYGAVCYVYALLARVRIRDDLKRIALPQSF